MEAPRAGTPPMSTPVPKTEPEDAFIEPSTSTVPKQPETVPSSRPTPDYDAEPIRRTPVPEPMAPVIEEAPRERRPAAPRNEAEFVPRNRDGVRRGPDLKMEIKGPTQVALGSPVVLEFRISNVGNAPATGVVATDLLPEGLKHPVSPDLEYRIGQLAPGESRSTQLKLTADKAGRIVNRAQVTADGRLLDEASVEVQVVSDRASGDRGFSERVQVEHTGPVRWYYGLSAYFTTELVNPGAEELRDVEVVQKLPVGVKFVEATQNGRYDRESNTVTWKLASLSSRERRTLQATILPAGSGQHESAVVVRDAQGESGKGRWGVCVICPPTTGY